MERYDFTYMKKHQNHRNVGTYASLMDPMGMIENSGVVGGGKWNTTLEQAKSWCKKLQLSNGISSGLSTTFLVQGI